MINVINKHVESNKDFSMLLEMLLDAIMFSTIVNLLFNTVLSFSWKLPSLAESRGPLDSSADIKHLRAGILMQRKELVHLRKWWDMLPPFLARLMLFFNNINNNNKLLIVNYT